ncbi:MAG: gliding motility-associated C-terminal domain-containing protein [Bacteroidales bacterium]|jgi:gliding motility-associated-like protein|nr:gliding motility-associated C-terminal domain-containing protein [Bacteroidales bacterium]
MKKFISFLVVFFTVAGSLYGSSGEGVSDAERTDPPKRVRKSITTTTCGWTVNISSDPVKCPGENNGKIRIKVSGVNAPYDLFEVNISGYYSPTWYDNTSDSLIIDNLSSGTYEVTVTHENFSCRVSEPVIIEEPTLEISITNQKNLCPHTTKTGAITVSTSTDQKPESQTWYWDPSYTSSYQEIHPANTKNLDAGQYKIVLTDGAGCEVFVETELYQLQPFSATISHTDVLCGVENTGIITIENPQGGSIVSGSHLYPYIYEVRNSGGNIVQTSNTSPITGLPEGDFTVRIKEDHPASASCYVDSMVTIADTLAKLDKPDIDSVPPSNCSPGNDGSLIIKATNPAGRYSYWYSKLAADIFEPFDPADAQETTIRDLEAEKYKVVLKEIQGGCVSDTVEVEIPKADPPKIKVVADPVTKCDTKDNGAITITVTEPATGTYTYWYSGLPNDDYQPFDPLNPDAKTIKIEDLTAGEYKVTVKAATGACISDTAKVKVDSISIKIEYKTVDDPFCIGKSDGKGTITITDGTAPFNVDLVTKPWYAENPEITKDDDRNFTIEKVTGGEYELKITNNFSCELDTVLKIEVKNEDVIEIDAEPADPTACSDGLTPLGSAMIEITQPASPDALWQFKYYVNQNDSGKQASTTKKIQNLAPGEYEMAARIVAAPDDEDGCLDTALVVIEDITRAEIWDSEKVPPSCVGSNNGKYSFWESSGGEYQYQLAMEGVDTVPGNWIKIEASPNKFKIDTVTVSYVWAKTAVNLDTVQFTGLASGNYTLWVRDKITNCRYEGAYIDLNVDQKMTLTIEDSIRLENSDSTLCVFEGMDVKLIVSDGTRAYTYYMDADLTGSADSIFTIDDQRHTFRVIDADGCSIDTAYQAKIPEKVKIDAYDISVLACNQDTGHIRLSGAKDDYSYLWTSVEDNRTLSQDSLLEKVMAGEYRALVTESLGICIWDSTFEITARHYLVAKIDGPGEHEFCPNEPVDLTGTVALADPPPPRDTVPVLSGDPNLLTAKWRWVFAGESDSVDFFPLHETLSLKADSGYVTLRASYQFHPDTVCTSADTFAITVREAPVLDFLLEDSVIYIPKDETYTMGMKIEYDFEKYEWSSIPEHYATAVLSLPALPADEALLTPPTPPDRLYLLRLTLEGANGCKASDSVYVGSSSDFFIPNAFTPNGDGVHDRWTFYPLEQYRLFYTVSVAVFNRSGMLVYECRDYSNDPSVAFDGRRGNTDLPIGVYYYVVKLIDRSHREPDQVFTGSVTVIR